MDHVSVLQGLHPDDAARRLEQHGPNELPPPPRERLPTRVLRHLRDPMAVLLMAAAAVAGLGLGERVDAVAILTIVVLNAVIGVVQEGKAARALDALRAMETPRARVRRGGRVARIPAREVVPGDVVLLAAGDRVPADIRLLRTASLEVDESLLTGESLPVGKDADGEETPDAGLGERLWMAHAGTLVAAGSGEGEVSATGAGTELGAIARALAGPRRATPLQRELRTLTVRLGMIAVAISLGVFGLVVARTGFTAESLQEAFLFVVALAVAAVPEGLATVVTVGLALGVRRMAQRGAIVRRLAAVETLGSTTAILTDKTGTLTENRMRLQGVAVGPGPPTPVDELPPDLRERALRVMALCSDAELDPPSGDPVEVALVEAVGLDRLDELRTASDRAAVAPFDARRRRMSVAVELDGRRILLVKGAPEEVVERADRLLGPDGAERPMDAEERRALLRNAEALAEAGARLLALADRDPAAAEDPLEERDLALVGMAALRDPVRAAAPGAVSMGRDAGIRVVMVTGDHAGTAAAVAREVGLETGGREVRTGARLRAEGIPEDPLASPVYARVDPGDKLQLVEALQERGEVVAVTGDGVNDAPALRRADIGVAMGRGSDVAREAADMVVTDDDLATIVSAVREGRGIYDNIRKVVDYLVGGNLSEIMVVVGALLLFPALGPPLLPLQLLWINLLTDGLPALALGADPVDPGLMRLPPRDPRARMLSARRVGLLAWRGAVIAAASVGSLWVARGWGASWPEARTTMFTVLVLAHLLYAFAVRRRGQPPLANRWLLGAMALGFALQLLIVAWEPARAVFDTTTLDALSFGLVAAAGTLPVAVIVAVERLVERRRGLTTDGAGPRAPRSGPSGPPSR